MWTVNKSSDVISVVFCVVLGVAPGLLGCVESTILSGSGMVDSSQFKSVPLEIFVTPL